MIKKEEWKNRLEPFEKGFYNFYNVLQTELNDKTTEELEELIEDCNKASRTNCGFGLYRACPFVVEECRRIIYMRLPKMESNTV